MSAAKKGYNMGYQNDNNETKQKILDVTMKMIIEHGMQSITVRKIALAAGVNVAAVNYHFGSKGALINKVLENSLLEMQEIFHELDHQEIPADERLSKFISRYLRFMIRYPDITKNMIQEHIKEHPAKDAFIEYLSGEGSAYLINTIQQIVPEVDKDSLSMKIMQLFACLAYPILIGNGISDLFGIELNSNENIDKYTGLLIKNIKG